MHNVTHHDSLTSTEEHNHDMSSVDVCFFSLRDVQCERMPIRAVTACSTTVEWFVFFGRRSQSCHHAGIWQHVSHAYWRAMLNPCIAFLESIFACHTGVLCLGAVHIFNSLQRDAAMSVL